MFRPLWLSLFVLTTSVLSLSAQERVLAESAEPLLPVVTRQQDGGSTYWVGAGLGFGTSDSTSDDFGGSVNLSYRFDPHLLSLRAATVGELFGDDFWDIGLLYGRATGQGAVFASLAAGIAVMGGTRNPGGIFDESSETISSRISLPLELQLYWRPLRFLGLGVYGFANFNDEESFGGATFGLQLGRLRPD